MVRAIVLSVFGEAGGDGRPFDGGRAAEGAVARTGLVVTLLASVGDANRIGESERWRAIED